MRKAALTLALALFAAPVSAQESPAKSSTTGFSLNAHISGASLRITENNDSETESGGGIGLHVGYGFSPRFLMFIGADVATIDSNDPEIASNYELAHVELGARYSFANPQSRWVPYLQASLGGRSVSAETIRGDFEARGGVFSIGGGVQYFLSRKVALNGAVFWSGGEFSTISLNGIGVTNAEIDATSTRLNLGVAWYPRGQ